MTIKKIWIQCPACLTIQSEQCIYEKGLGNLVSYTCNKIDSMIRLLQSLMVAYATLLDIII